MSEANLAYHRSRVEHCRSLAEQARDPEVRRRHEELAALHASRMNIYLGAAGGSAAAAA